MDGRTTNIVDRAVPGALRFGVAIVVVIGVASSTAYSQVETSLVRPTAVLRWSALVELDRALAALPKPRHVVKPFVPEPPPRYVNSSLRAIPSGAHDLLGVRDAISKTPTSLGLPAPGYYKAQVSIAVGFASLPDDGMVIPPDTNGAVGLDHVMTMLNSAVRIQDKSGSVVVPDITLAGFWAPLGAETLADPRLVYDAAVSRWYATVIADFRSTTSAVFLAVSASNDPTGVWTFYSIDADP